MEPSGLEMICGKELKNITLDGCVLWKAGSELDTTEEPKIIQLRGWHDSTSNIMGYH